MERTSRIPGDVKVVVPPARAGVLRDQLPPLAVITLTVVAAGFGLAATGAVAWLVVGAVCVVGIALQLLSMRSELALGPAFAADADHVWVRLGGFFAPRSVRLDWPEITGIGIREWQGHRRSARARFLTVQLTGDALAALSRLPGRRRRDVSGTLGAPLAISDQRKAISLDEAFRGLRFLAPDGVRFTND
ncbi:MAG TPA: hypothetical protein VH969_15650 [Actinophytocola sp.]|uniref:hypothetical protein n=1 Tax=Actinophytocola sp. TaxID=1872138 RepID=UPI002F95513E